MSRSKWWEELTQHPSDGEVWFLVNPADENLLLAQLNGSEETVKTAVAGCRVVLDPYCPRGKWYAMTRSDAENILSFTGDGVSPAAK